MIVCCGKHVKVPIFVLILIFVTMFCQFGYNSTFWKSRVYLLEIFNNLCCSLPPDIKALASELIHKTFLDELVFWTVKYEFPQKIVTFLLNMLPDNNYKVSVQGS